MRDVLPPVLREDQSARVAVLPGVLVLSVLVVIAALRPALLEDGLDATAAWLVTGATIAVALATIGLLVATAFTSSLTQAVPHGSRVFAPGLVVPAALSLYGISRSGLGGTRAEALAIACVAAIAMAVALGRHARRVARTPAHRNWTAGRPQEIEELIAELRHALPEPSLPTQRRIALELLLASSLADLAFLTDRYNDLPEAEQILARSMDTGIDAGLAGAAMSIAPALVTRALWTEDLVGLDDGLELVARTISNVPTMQPVVCRALLTARVRGLVLLRDQAEVDGDAARAERLHAAAVEDLQRALRLTHRGSFDRADLLIKLASIGSGSAQERDLDAAIRRGRLALRGLRFRRMGVREAAYMALVALLEERAQRDSDPDSPDLAEALRLCRLVGTRGVRRSAGALARLPILLDMTGADDSVIADAFRRAFAAQSAVSFDQACTVATEWAEWAEDRCHTTEAAEAFLCMIRAGFTASQRLRLRGERRRPPFEIQELTAGAAFWLLAAGRPRDAALVLDLGCGAGLTERMHRDRGDVEQRLMAAGREDLRDRWLAVGERIAAEASTASDTLRDRSGFNTISVGRQRFRGRFASRDGIPLADYERLVREIGRLPSFEDVDAPPTYEDLREAAHDGPLVYLAATAHGGYAVVVTDEASEPVVVALPGITSDDAAARVLVLLDPEWADVAGSSLELTLTWLRRYVLKPLAPALGPAALVTLVPVGALGLLPVHAAGMQPMPNGSWRDTTGGLVLRYAPNARLLTRAKEHAHESAGADVPIVTVGDPPAGRGHDGSATSVDQVPGELGDATIWHIACRTEHDPYDLLSSCLRLADGSVSLRALLAPEQPGPRLALLSACRTTLGQDPDLDEAFPIRSALLHGGAAGVVCSETGFDGPGGSLLMLAFLQRFLDGAEPARALAEAQGWLSAATNRDIADAFGPLHACPDDLPRGARRDWEHRRQFAEPFHWAAYSYCGA
ncbi:MAG: hypothetical protein QOJ63_2824 [Solirubrobacteraceae bacterium]|jgi:hypothetical protein|nr:hypothetical protein [Solirubrobacteraceae bacterium]